MADETVTQQIVREAPEIEAIKLQLLKQAQALGYNQIPKVDSKGNIVKDAKGNVVYVNASETLADKLPAYKIAGFTAPQTTAMQAAVKTGIGSYDPYMNAADTALNSAYTTTGEAADILRGADTRNQFADAQAAMKQAGQATGNITSGIGQIGTGLGYLDTAAQRALDADTTDQFGIARTELTAGSNALGQAQNLANQYKQADLTAAQAAIQGGIGGLTTAQQMATTAGPDYTAAQKAINQGVSQGQQSIGLAQNAAKQAGFTTAGGAYNQGLAALSGAQQAYDPTSAQSFMDPYRQQVIDEAMKQIERQGALQREQLATQAIRAGAFGGEREAVQRAELERNIMDQKASTIANLLSQGYSQAQANAMATFEQQQSRQLQAGQGIGQLGSQASQTAAQKGALEQNAANLAAQQGALGVQAGSQLGALETQGSQLDQAAAALYGNLAQDKVAAGQGLGQLGVQQAQLGQGAANIQSQAAQQYGNLASQGGALAGQESAIDQGIASLLMQQSAARNQAAQTEAAIYGQQAQELQDIGQGIGQLAGQQFAIGQQTAAGIGAMGAQLGQIGVQEAALGQTAQAIDQGDVNFLYNVGQAQQAFNQQALDAQRANEMQKIYAPYQQAAFVSDIYKGAPSTQMSTAATSVPTASPFQTAAGVALGATSTAAAAKKAGLI